VARGRAAGAAAPSVPTGGPGTVQGGGPGSVQGGGPDSVQGGGPGGGGPGGGGPGGGGAGGFSTYLTLLRDGSVRRPFAASVLARLPISMAPIGLVLLVQQVRGAYRPAGLVTGAYALGTACGAPLWGRAMDRLGQPTVIAATASTSAALLATLALTAVHGGGDPVLLGLAFLAGLTFPPMSPAMRGAWRELPDPRRRRGGYALDSVAVESIFVSGPLVLSLLLGLAVPEAPLLITAAVLVVGGVTYARTAAARRVPSSRRPRAGPSPGEAAPREPGPAARSAVLRARGIPAVLLATAGMAVGFGQIDTSLAATARTVFGTSTVLGYLFAAIAGGSVVGGLTYGALAGHRGEAARLPVTLGAFGILLVPMTILLSGGRPSLWALEPLLFLAGLCISPSLIIMANLVDVHAPGARASEAQAWLGTATTAGAAAGTALAGALIDSGGVSRALTGALVAILVAAVAAAGGQRTWRREAPA